jgi:hypothetical protein
MPHFAPPPTPKPSGSLSASPNQTILCLRLSPLKPYALISVVAFPETCASLIVPGI